MIMDALAVSELLNRTRIWHRIANKSVVTKRLVTPIPEIGCKVAYLAGVITGDGSLNVSKRRKGANHYRIQVVGRLEDLERVAVLFKELFNYRPKVQRDQRKANCYLMNVNSAAIFFYFLGLGFASGKKRDLKVPPAIAADAILFKHYLLGLVDTDGHISRRRIHLKQREESFLNELVQLLAKHLGIESNPPKVNYTEGKPFYYVRFPMNDLHCDF